MNSRSESFKRVLPVAICALALSGVAATLGACDKQESKSSTETKRVVDTPEGKKTVTDKQETKTTTEKK